MVSKEEYHTYVENVLKTEMKKKEDEEKDKYSKLLSKIIPVQISLGIAFLLLFLFGTKFGIMFLCVPVAIAFTIAMFVPIKYKNKHFNPEDYKQMCIPKVLDFLLKGYKYTYNAEESISEDVFGESPFNTGYEEFQGSDLLSINLPGQDGNPSNIWLKVSNVVVTKMGTTVTYEGLKSCKVTVFDGIMTYIQFPENFKFKFGINISIPGAKKIMPLEDILFNKRFKIYSDNELEAVMLMSPDKMFKLNDFSNKFSDLKIALLDNKAFLTSNENFFNFKFNEEKTNLTEEINKMKKITTAFDKPDGYITDKVNDVTYDIIYNNIAKVFDIIAAIKNNKKLFKI